MTIKYNVFKDLSKGQNIEERLPEYIAAASANYKSLSLCEMALEYYLMYEIIEGGTNPWLDSKSDEQAFIRRAMRELVDGKSISGMKDEIVRIRELITKKMQVVTAYVDRIIVYEYIMNRMEAKYTMDDEERKNKLEGYNYKVYANRLASYIFLDEDSAGVNDRIREVLGQLPVRMGRGKYLELIKNSLKLYGDSDVEALDGYIYMLKTTAMLYKPEGSDEFFVEFGERLSEFDTVDFANIDKAYYTILDEKLTGAAQDIHNISDALMTFQKIINMLYVYAIVEDMPDSEYEDKQINEIALDIIAESERALCGESDGEAIEELLPGLEGKPEQMYSDRIRVESVYEDIKMGSVEMLEGFGFNDELDNIGLCIKLFSPSIFAELNDKEAVDVTGEYIDNASDELIKEMSEAFEKRSKYINRAVMSLTMSNIPVFFENGSEVCKYIEDVLNKCSNESELIAIITILDDLMEY